MAKVIIALANGFEEVEALAQADLLRRVGAEVRLLTITEDIVVKGARGINVVADGMLCDANWQETEMLILPGGMPGTTYLAQSDMVHEGIRYMLEHDRYVAAICAAPALVLGEHGYLEGGRATCYPGMEEHLKGAVALTDNVVTSGRIITSRGVGTALELGITLVKALYSKEIADKLALDIVY
ncbi:MAG: DJ-1/PfpI family protein [Clostridiales bacterium]|nr:DJ-1/PfpI family protein [Clostridiales bacterium]